MNGVGDKDFCCLSAILKRETKIMKSSITITFVPEITNGPFVFPGNLELSCQKSSELGFDGVELFIVDPKEFSADSIHTVLERYNLELAALGTGAAYGLEGLSLSSPDNAVRANAIQRIKEHIQLAAPFKSRVIIGSMRGKVEAGVDRNDTKAWLAESLHECLDDAKKNEVTIFLEAINRYESNLLNSVEETARYIKANELNGMTVLADMFHMNIEEVSFQESILNTRELIGHIHFVDSNRKAVGYGHIDAVEVVNALKEINFEGYLSGEILPLPTPDEAAKMTIESFKKLV